MGAELSQTFIENMAEQDHLIICDPVYFGGTTNRSVGSEIIVETVASAGRAAEYIAERSACGDRLVELAAPRDRILVMGARDDTLTSFAQDILYRLG